MAASGQAGRKSGRSAQRTHPQLPTQLGRWLAYQNDSKADVWSCPGTDLVGERLFRHFYELTRRQAPTLRFGIAIGIPLHVLKLSDHAFIDLRDVEVHFRNPALHVGRHIRLARDVSLAQTTAAVGGVGLAVAAVFSAA